MIWTDNPHKVFMVVEPKLEGDADAVKRREKAIKRAKIATAELFRTSPLEVDPAASDGTEGGQPLFALCCSVTLAERKLCGCSTLGGFPGGHLELSVFILVLRRIFDDKENVLIFERTQKACEHSGIGTTRWLFRGLSTARQPPPF